MAENGYHIYQYDHTIEHLPAENAAFHWKKLGLTGENETAELKNLGTLLAKNWHEKTTGMVLKMDIEGYEWGVLAHCGTEVPEQFDQIVLELHDLLQPADAPLMREALQNLCRTHQVVYLHGNNGARVDYSGDIITPDLLEATFVLRSKYRFAPATLCLPTAMDQPCKRELPEIRLGRWNLTE